MEGTRHTGMSMPLFIEKVAYSIVQQASVDPDPTSAPELDPVLEPIWAQDSIATKDYLELVFPSDEVIIEALTHPDRPWDDIHHIYYFLPDLRRIEVGEFVLTLSSHAVYAKGNMETMLKRYLLKSLEPLASWRMSLSEQTTPPRRFKSTQIYLKNSTMFFLGLTRKFQAFIQESSNMR
jgi:hypothetical protein